jgi:molybdopterin-binding protein
VCPAEQVPRLSLNLGLRNVTRHQAGSSRLLLFYPVLHSRRIEVGPIFRYLASFYTQDIYTLEYHGSIAAFSGGFESEGDLVPLLDDVSCFGVEVGQPLMIPGYRLLVGVPIGRAAVNIWFMTNKILGKYLVHDSELSRVPALHQLCHNLFVIHVQALLKMFDAVSWQGSVQRPRAQSGFVWSDTKPGRCPASQEIENAVYTCSMSLSARNQLQGIVEAIELGGVMAHVTVRVGDNIVESVITRRSVEEMKLKKGDRVKAVIKSTEVMLLKD